MTTHTAESQGLPEGFNDDLAFHENDEAAGIRPRPATEIRDVAGEIAAERIAYDQRHSVQALQERRGAWDEDIRGRTEYPQPTTTLTIIPDVPTAPVSVESPVEAGANLGQGFAASVQSEIAAAEIKGTPITATSDLSKAQLVALLDEHGIDRPSDSKLPRTHKADLVALVETSIAAATLDAELSALGE